MYSSIDSNFTELNYSASVLNNCEAFKARFDGFGNRAEENAVSTMVLNNCHGHYCYDDGVSHHNGHFYINGGEYDHNNKGGVSSPTYGALGGMANVYIHHNKYGMYAVANAHVDGNVMVSNCIFEDNEQNVNNYGYRILLKNNTFGQATYPNYAHAPYDSENIVY